MAYKVSWPSCSICGTKDDPIYTCPVCHEYVCKDHYNTSPDTETCDHTLELTRSTGWVRTSSSQHD